nr:fimbrillin family protein [Parabacteroides goldsteinii]
MKRTEQLYRTAVLLTLLMLAAACTRDDTFDDAAPGNGTDPAAVLTITVTDGAYAAAPSTDTPEASAANAATNNGAPVTRAVERGFATEFTAGDAIGIYVVKKTKEAREAILENGKFTYDGQTWEAEQSQALPSIPHDDEYLYFAYYPYQKDKDMSSKYKVSIKKDDAKDFFQYLINWWDVENDQSTYAEYTANDLMVARGVVAPLPDGSQASPSGSTLTFTMEHQMVLVVIRLPHTIYTYTETIDGKDMSKSYNLYTGGYVEKWWQENHYTARRIMSLNSTWNTVMTSYYYDSEFNKHKFAATATTENVTGIYKIYTVDDGKETTTERPLAEGDFYMKDGTVLPKEAFGDKEMPDDVKQDCIGVVFWVGEKEETHWTQTGHWHGDHLLTHDHPTCTHGMVVALQNASESPVAWATKSKEQTLWGWANAFSGFTDNEKSLWKMVLNSDTNYGYVRSALFGLYTAYNTDAEFPAYEAVKVYAGIHPTPEGCSGWFFPSQYELATMWFDSPDKFPGKIEPIMLNKINPQIEKAGGSKLKELYWSSLEINMDDAWIINFESQSNFFYRTESQDTQCNVRAVLAF